MNSKTAAIESAEVKQPGPKQASAWQFTSVRDWLANRQTTGKILIAASIVIVIYIGYTAMLPHQWIFSVQAQSRIVELVTPANKETRWRINNAILCARGPLELPAEKFAPIAPGNLVCGSKHWSGYHILEPEQTLVLSGTINAVLELRERNSTILALRMHRPGAGSQATEEPAATENSNANRLAPGASLSFTDGSPDISLVQNGKLRINIIFPDTDSNTLSVRIFPFTAETTIGRDINWTGTSLLTTGEIEVYTSDTSPDKRKRVETAKLLLGDQLRLYPLERDHRMVYPKGFIRLEPGKDYFDVIAFGAADFVRIERFGDNGYDFRPGLLLRLFNDQVLILILSIFVALATLLATVANVCGKKAGE